MYPFLGIAAFALIFTGFSTPVAAQFVGLDANTDFTCEPSDMAWTAGEGDVGSVHSIRLYFDDLPPAVAWGCTFCVTEKSRIGEVLWTFRSPGPSWTFEQVCDTEVYGDDCDMIMGLAFPQPLPTPNSRCWFAGAVDYSFSSPIESYPCAVGVLEYQVAEEGEIKWLIDGPNTAILSTGFATYVFDEPGEVCAGTAATATTSWGSVKALFR